MLLTELQTLAVKAGGVLQFLLWKGLHLEISLRSEKTTGFEKIYYSQGAQISSIVYIYKVFFS